VNEFENDIVIDQLVDCEGVLVTFPGVGEGATVCVAAVV
jgi:hypothetical protein